MELRFQKAPLVKNSSQEFSDCVGLFYIKTSTMMDNLENLIATEVIYTDQ